MLDTIYIVLDIVDAVTWSLLPLAGAYALVMIGNAYRG